MFSLKKFTYLLVVLPLLLGCLDTAFAQTPQLTVNPSQIVFNVQPGQTAPAQTIRLDTSNAQSVQFRIDILTQGGSWLVYSPQVGNTPADIFVSASSGGLQTGSYTGALTITANGVSNSPLTIPITLNVGSQLATTPASLAFSYQTSSTSAPPPQVIAVNSTGPASVQYTVTAQMATGSGWLTATPPSGLTPGNVSVSVNPAGLAPGTYNGNVRLTPIAAGASSSDVPVTLTITGNPVLSASPSSLSFAYQTGTTAPAAQVLTFSSTGAAIPFTLTPAVDSGPNWLVLSSFSGQASQGQPQQIMVNANVAGLVPGNYTGRIMVSAPNAATPNFNIPVNLLVSANPLLILGNPPQPFNFQLGGANPPAQTVQVNSSSTPINIAATATVTGGTNWLTVTPATGTTPQALSLTVNPAGLAPGSYNGTVSVTSANAGNSPQTFPVQLVISATTLLNVNTSGLTFNYQTTGGAQQPPAQIFRVTSTGAPLNFTATAASSTCGGNNWITVAPTTGTTPADLTISVNTTGIVPGTTCAGTISISAPGASNTATVPITLNVSANPLLNIAPSVLSFTTAAGSTAPLPVQVISLTSTDPNTAIAFNYTSTTSTGGPWLFVASTGAMTPSNLSVTANPSGLGAGTYNGTITITSGNLPAAQIIPVTLIVTSNVNAVATPATATLTVPQNSTAAATQLIQLTTSGGSTQLTFSASASTTTGGNWLTVTPTGGTTPAALTVSASGVGLVQGTYNGLVTVVMPGAANSPLNIPVVLTVGAPQSLAVSSNNVQFAYQLGGPNPANQTVNVTSTAGPIQYAVTAATTSCGNFLSATPASGTTPGTVTIAVNVTGVAAGTTCAGTVTVSAQGIQPQVINVSLTVSAAAVPVLAAIQNAASSAPGSIAPGEIIVIYGSNIGPPTLTTYILDPKTNMFATTVADTTVLFGNVPAPILYTSVNQTSVVVPFQVAGQPTVDIKVQRAGQTSVALTVRIVDYAPGLFTTNQQGTGQGAIVNQNGTVNAANNPAARGSVVALYLTGAGLVSTNPATGSVVPADPLPVITASVAVTIGGVAARVDYKGAAPLAIAGLYQFNVTVPDGAPLGAQPVAVTVGGVQAQSGVTMTIQ
jgi:uncharacterized protein (TIGR03437 family)